MNHDRNTIFSHQVIYLEDEDVASVKNGVLSIHRLGNDGNTPTDRYVNMLYTGDHLVHVH